MDISIFGMGYVGCITAVGFASLGHYIVGVDVNKEKVDFINKGKSPVVEKDLNSLMEKFVNKGRIIATTSETKAIINSDASFVCVGTPSGKAGKLNLDFVKQVCISIGKALKQKDTYHLVVFKSTMFPGSVENDLIPLLERGSGKKAGRDFGVCHNPEFLREASGLEDFFHPPHNVIGELDKRSGDFLLKVYKKLKVKNIRTTIKIAEMIKYVNNSWHALKVSFANEIGIICKEANVDSHRLMNVFCDDKKLNLSSYYLKPGFPYGGSCLTKDLAALRKEAKNFGLNVPLLNSISKSNRNHINNCINIIKKTKKKKITILGFSFKAGTDDVRGSPMLLIVEHLIKKGFDVKIYDKNVSKAKKFGINKLLLKSISKITPHFVDSIEYAVKNSDIIVIGTKDDEYKDIFSFLKPNCCIVDFHRLLSHSDLQKNRFKGTYDGI